MRVETNRPIAPSQPLKNNTNHLNDSEPIQGRSFKVLQQITEPKSNYKISYIYYYLIFKTHNFRTKLFFNINILFSLNVNKFKFAQLNKLHTYLIIIGNYHQRMSKFALIF